MKGDSHFSAARGSRRGGVRQNALDVSAQVVKVAHLIPRANIPQRGKTDGQTGSLLAKILRSAGETTGGNSRRAKNLKAVLLE